MEIVGDLSRKQARLLESAAASIPGDDPRIGSFSFTEAKGVVDAVVPLFVTAEDQLIVFDQGATTELMRLDLTESRHDGNGTHLSHNGLEVRVLGPINRSLLEYGTNERQTLDPLNRYEAASVSDLSVPLDGASRRWQYAVVNVGSFNSPSRMASVLASAGEAGWELISVYDKASNWFQGMEKGFMLLKRPVPEGTDPGTWCLLLTGWDAP